MSKPTITRNAPIDEKLTIYGALSDTGLFQRRLTYAPLKVTTAGGTPTTLDAQNQPAIGTVKPTSLASYGHTTTVALTRWTAGQTNAVLHTFTWTDAHILGTSYVVGAHFQTCLTSDTAPVRIMTTNVPCATSFNVWIRTTVGTVANVLPDGTQSTFATSPKKYKSFDKHLA